jgi:hypothetical protein
MAINPAGTLPPELFEQQQQLNRQQQMAQLLMQQGQQMPQGQMVSGRYVAPSFFQNILPLAQMYVGKGMAEQGDKQAINLAEALRKNRMQEAESIMGAKTPEEQLKIAMGGYSPISQQLAGKLIERRFKEPKWEKAELPNPDGSIRKGWVDYNSANPLNTFVEGGTKPAFTPLEAARFQYDTGMRLPTGGAVPANAPANAPMNMPTGNMPAQVSGNAMPVNAMPSGSMPPQVPAMGGGRGMSPAAMSEANKQVFVDVEKRRIENLEKSPQVLATMTDTLLNIDNLIGDARVIKDAKGKEKIDYTVTQDGKQVQGRKPQAGFELAVGAGIPSWMPFQGGTDVSNFRIALDQIKDKTFLQAFESLKGAGQITEREGEKATSALNRMNIAQSEVEFIKAAREFEQNVRSGMDMAKKKAGLPTGNTPRLRWNPKTNSWE